MTSLGTEHGYQHLWLEGKGKPPAENGKFQWMNKGRFYSLTAATSPSDELLFTRIGANDPEFNLRRDAALIIRRKNVQNTVFASVIEPHGGYDPVSEFSVNSKSNIGDLQVVHDDDYTAVTIEDKQGERRLFVISNLDSSATGKHQLRIDGRNIQWQGPYYYGNTSKR